MILGDNRGFGRQAANRLRSWAEERYAYRITPGYINELTMPNSAFVQGLLSEAGEDE